MQENKTVFSDRLLEKIGLAFPLKEQDPGEFSSVKVSGMNFRIRSFDAEGFGCVSLMTCSGMLGLMKMDSLILNPFETDMPLLSYDRIHAMGNDKDYIEMFETRLTPVPLADAFAAIRETCADLPDAPSAPCWYDDIHLPEGIRKSGKKADTPRLDRLTLEYLDIYLKLAKDAPACDPAAKKTAASAYTEGLLNNGGPSTDQFIKAKGKEYTSELFRIVLFGTGTPKSAEKE